MLPPLSNLLHAAHKPHLSAWPPERARAIHTARMNQEAVFQRSPAVFAANVESESLLKELHPTNTAKLKKKKNAAIKKLY